MFTVYALIDPRYGDVRYVGLTEDVYARFSQHVRCDSTNIDKNRWIQSLKDAQLMLIMKTLETTETLEEARRIELKWIKHHLSQGTQLLNVSGAHSLSFEDFTRTIKKFGKPAKHPPQPPKPTAPLQEFWPDGRRKIYTTYEEAAACTGFSVEELKKKVKKREVIESTSSPGKLLTSSVKNLKRIYPYHP